MPSLCEWDPSEFASLPRPPRNQSNISNLSSDERDELVEANLGIAAKRDHVVERLDLYIVDEQQDSALLEGFDSAGHLLVGIDPPRLFQTPAIEHALGVTRLNEAVK